MCTISKQHRVEAKVTKPCKHDRESVTKIRHCMSRGGYGLYPNNTTGQAELKGPSGRSRARLSVSCMSACRSVVTQSDVDAQ